MSDMALSTDIDVSNVGNAILHEFFHLLGFSAVDFPNFPENNASPPSIGSAVAISATERGNSIHRLTLPRTVLAASEHFDCSYMEGVEMENWQTTGVASHFESRTYRVRRFPRFLFLSPIITPLPGLSNSTRS